jgi:hypothetical protein
LIVGIRLEPLSVPFARGQNFGHGKTPTLRRNRLFDAKRRDGEQPLAGWLAFSTSA